MLKVNLNSDQIRRKALRVLLAYSGVHSVKYGLTRETQVPVGFGIDAIKVGCTLRKKFGFAQITTVGLVTASNDTSPTTVKITELQPTEDTGLERKRSLGILISEEQPEQSEIWETYGGEGTGRA